jgi:hypothetical protein
MKTGYEDNEWLEPGQMEFTSKSCGYLKDLWVP